MKKLISAQAIVAASAIAFFPLAATANSFAQEQAFGHLSQPLNVSSSIETDHIDVSSVNVGDGQSYAAANALERVQGQSSTIKTAYITASSVNVGGGQSHAAANALEQAQGNANSHANLQQISQGERDTALNS